MILTHSINPLLINKARIKLLIVEPVDSWVIKPNGCSFSDGATFENGKPKALIALVIMGSNDRLSDSSQRIRTTVCGVHPGFKTDGPIMYYDIAFCQLKTPIILDDPKVWIISKFLFLNLNSVQAPVQPACLPGTLELNEERKQKMCVATGFGTTSKF